MRVTPDGTYVIGNSPEPAQPPSGHVVPDCEVGIEPQHVTAPEAWRTHAWVLFAPISTASEIPGTSRGTRLIATALPSWRVFPLPQHATRPSEYTAHEKSSPAATAVASVIPTTATGVNDGVCVPLPSWPLGFSPQHTTPPRPRTAHVWPRPLATAIGPLQIPVEQPHAHVAAVHGASGDALSDAESEPDDASNPNRPQLATPSTSHQIRTGRAYQEPFTSTERDQNSITDTLNESLKSVFVPVAAVRASVCVPAAGCASSTVGTNVLWLETSAVTTFALP